MAMATSATTMSHVGKKAGTLVVVVMKAKNLPNRQKIGKQDPYCIVRLSHTAERTKTDKRGGQSPFWDHETRFPIPINAGQDYQTLKVTVFSDDSKDPILVGDASIDLKSVYKDGEFDEWVELKFKGRYAGEIYLEMTYYSEAPPPVPALPKEIMSRGLQSRGGSQTGGGGGGGGGGGNRLKRRPLPQQPDLSGLGPPPPSRGFPRHPYEPLPPSTSYSNYPPSTSHSNRPPSTSHSNHSSFSQIPPSTSHSTHSSYSQPPPSTSHSTHSSFSQFPPSTSHGTPSSYSYSSFSDYPVNNYVDEYPPSQDQYYNDNRHRQHSLDYEPQYHHPLEYDIQPHPHEYPQYHQPQSPTLGRHRSEASLRTQYYDIRPLQEVEREQFGRFPPAGFREERHNLRPRTSLPLPPVPREPLFYPQEQHIPPPPPQQEPRYHQPRRRESLDDYYNTPPPDDPYLQPIRQSSPLRTSTFDDEYDEPIPVQPYISQQKQLPSSPPQPYSPHSHSLHNTPVATYSPKPPSHHSTHNTPTQGYAQNTYSPHTPIALPQKYSLTPPVHSTPPTTHVDQTPPPPPSRASASPRTPLHGPSPPLKKPSPIRAIDHLPPSSYAPERTPPSQRRPLPTPPAADSSPSEYSQHSSPLAQRKQYEESSPLQYRERQRDRPPELPAKIPMGMTEREWRELQALEERERIQRDEEGGIRLRGLYDDGTWREVREALPEVGYARR